MIKLTGVESIDNVFKGLPGQFQDKIMRTAHANAVQPLIDRAHYYAPVYKTGNLAESIGTVTAKSEVFGVKSELGLINVGPRRRGRYKGFHGHLNEFGTKTRYNKAGAERGEMKITKFMEPAWEQTKDKVESNITNQLGKQVYNFMKRTIKNNA
jgi:HK97 gp10 family phage protein